MAHEQFAVWVRTMRQARGLTQSQVNLPAGTIGNYESGRRIPKTFMQKQKLAQALQISLDAVYDALSEDDAACVPDVYMLIRTGQWTAAYEAVQRMQLESYRTSDTTVLAEAQQLLSLLTAAQPALTLSPQMAIEHPLQALEWGTVALRHNQWISAKGFFDAAAQILSSGSDLWGRLCNNLAITHQALGDLDAAVAWDGQYIAWAADRHDAWQTVIAHALALMHEVMRDPMAPILRPHDQILDRWRDVKRGLPDPLVQCWLLDAQVRVAVARKQSAEAQRLVAQYARTLDEHPRCRGERIRLADVQAQLLALEGQPERGATLLQMVLGQPDFLHEPGYIRLEVVQTWARLEGTVLAWRQLMQAYWALGARGWLERLAPAWQQVEPGATIDRPPLVLPA